MVDVKTHFNETAAADKAAKMLRSKTFSEVYSFIENAFSVRTNKVMEAAIEKYRFSFV